MIYFISDTHFNHRNCIWHNNRPFKNVEEMDAQLIKNWNRVVKNNDEIYHLGDFAWQVSPTRLKEIMEQLNGHKHLILGNHDKEKMMERYVSAPLLALVKQSLIDTLTPLLRNKYTGAFGVDMMITAGSANSFYLHPCVEINLRRTMGHTALSLSPDAYSAQGVMRVTFTGGKYKLRVTSVIDNLLNTSVI